MSKELASYAACSEYSKGRSFKDQQLQYRNEFQRDRDRVIHSSAFRRLEYKTQVFVNHEGDMFRTRLTHSIEVAQIGRTIARVLHLNEDLTEAICLAHDLGHTPFGHAGQDMLNKCMADFGGFEHNLQSLRIVDVLESRYADFPGLNLTYETREGILKHCSRKNALALGELGQRFINRQQPGLEAQIANIADAIAYNNHDVDDGLRAGLLSLEQFRQCQLLDLHYEHVNSKWKKLDKRRMRNEIIRRMINFLVTDLIENSRKQIQMFKPTSINAVRQAGEPLIVMSDETHQLHLQLKQFLHKNLYRHERVEKMADDAKQTVKKLFNAYMNKSDLLGAELQSTIQQAERDGIKMDKPRMIADYIAGMTDRFAIAELKRIH